MKTNTFFTRTLDLIARAALGKKSIIRKCHVNSFVKKVEFVPFLQPIFNAGGNTVVGCEVLLRIKTDEGHKSPASLIKDLEKGEHINNITGQLMDNVAQYFLHEDIFLPEGFYFSFNIYAPQLSSPKLVSDVLSFNAALKGKARLVLEIVERGTLKLDEDTMEVMEALMSKGISFAIDDFGAGTSSLKYIEHAGFSTIKIDRELTLSTGNTLVYQKLVDAIVALSSQLGLSVTAEGVENRTQLELLNKAGVNSMQGYYLAKPVGMMDFSNKYCKLCE
ncbi:MULTISPECIES: EAL domain-containing protein [unclassified Enterobacter]|uniref:EAL domain-containing protein n=1 Tax=unclassified Enterobacter TaxID=2608935 RepID=UPI002365CB89|nr:MULTISPECIES: EAL domain-containing protein [unclassified Enterobacter]